MRKFYVFCGRPGWTGFEIKETFDYAEMIEMVRKLEHQNEFLPTVFYGEKLEFEPAEIVKSWKVKEQPDR
jgi:hypothetical protein